MTEKKDKSFRQFLKTIYNTIRNIKLRSLQNNYAFGIIIATVELLFWMTLGISLGGHIHGIFYSFIIIGVIRFFYWVWRLDL